MNLEAFPQEIKENIEDQSLELLASINTDIIVIGGWAVRGLVGGKHGRYTLDIDGVASKGSRKRIKKKLISKGMQPSEADWGIQYFKKYEPEVEIPEDIDISGVQLRIEISDPRITEFKSLHYFEFSLKEYVIRTIAFHKKNETVEIMVPPVEHMAAVKLGLPVDYKNNFDSVMLLQLCEIQDVVEVIRNNDHWGEMVLRRLPKLIGRISDRNSTVYMLATNAGVDVRGHIRRLKEIESNLKSM